MIIIYNLSGLIVGVLGLILGLLVAVASGLVSPGGLTVAAVWIGAGLWWKYRARTDGKIGRFPALFFIPLPFWGAPVLLMSLLALVIEVKAGRTPPDPRESRFTADARMLDSASFTGDVALSRSLVDALGKIAVEEAKADNYHVFTRIGDDAVLVLVKSPNLKNFKMPARVELLHAIESILASQPQTKGKQPFIGVKGRIAFGAIRVPPDQIKTGSVLSESPLYDFYGPVAEPVVPGRLGWGRKTGGAATGEEEPGRGGTPGGMVGMGGTRRGGGGGGGGGGGEGGAGGGWGTRRGGGAREGGEKRGREGAGEGAGLAYPPPAAPTSCPITPLLLYTCV